MAQISHSQMAKLFRRLAHSYSAGLDLRSVFERECSYGPPGYRRHMKGISDDLRQGVGLAESMAAQSGYFPPLVLATVRAGEHGGRLEQSFDRLATHYDNLVRFRNRFLAAIGWPLFELAFTIFVIGALILVLGFIYSTNNMTPPDWFGFGLGTTGNFVLFFLTIFLLGSLLALAIVGSARGWFGTLPMRIARRVPLVGKTIECLALSRFAWTMSVAENAGMSALDTIRLALQSTQNYYYLRLEETLARKIQAGRQFYPAMAETGAFPDDFLIYVDNGETSGQLAEVMDRASQNLQETAENNLKTISVVGFVLVFCIIALIIGFTVITLFQQFYLNPMKQLM